MCGIWACISLDSIFQTNDFYSFYKMSKAVEQRGPDKSTVIQHPYCFFSFFRLAFHDLSPIGDQPFVFYENENTVCFLIANGEIYNYKSLITQYQLPMRSDNDCEVIYHLYRHFENDGVALCNALDGEFAFIFLEVQEGKCSHLIVGRDPFGVRPLFYQKDHSQYTFSSLVQGLGQIGQPFPPGFLLHYDFHLYQEHWIPYTNISQMTPLDFCKKGYKKQICDSLIEAVQKRMSGERPIACLLSGGLDSSLLCGILAKILKHSNLHTFSIGMEGSTDLVYAQQVADYLGTNHQSVFFTPQEGLEAIDQVIRACETWDITTIRASVGQFLLAKWISKNTPFKAIMNGDGADEAMMGYLYWYQAPTLQDAHQESIKRLKEIYLYDGLRVDRCLGWFGLEARLPYLDKAFIKTILETPIEDRIPTSTRMEKQLIRECFASEYPDILPSSVLWRKKEAFSDGVSSKTDSWFHIIQRYMESHISDEEFETMDLGFSEKPPTKEAYYYQKKFLQYFGKDKLHVIPHYWLPNWSQGLREPSARVLSVYSSQ